MLRLSLLLTCLAAASAATSTLQTLRSYEPCFKGGAVWPCLKERALGLFNKALLTDSIEIAPGLKIERDEEESNALHFDASDELELPSDPQARDMKLDQLLWSRATSFLRTRTISFDMQETGYNARFMKKKIKKYLIPFILMKLALTFLATKALLIGKVALGLTVFVMIKDFIEERKKSSHETYEVFAKHPESEYHYEASSPVHAVAQPLAQAHPSGFYPSKGRSMVPTKRPATTHPALDVNDNQYDNAQFAQMLAYGGQHRQSP